MHEQASSEGQLENQASSNYQAVRSAWVTAAVVGYTAFFQLFFNVISFDVAFHQDWMGNTTIFGPLHHRSPTHMNFMTYRRQWTMAAAIFAAAFGASPVVQKYCLRWFQFSSSIIAWSGLVLASVWPAVNVSPFGDICGVCWMFRISKILFGLGSGLAWCFGMAYLYGLTRREVHHEQLHLTGVMAIASLAGEAAGFGAAFTGNFTDWTWLFLTAAISVTAFVPPVVFNKCMKDYGQLNLPFNGQPIHCSIRGIFLEGFQALSQTMGSGRFLVRLLLASIQWSAVDLTRSAFKFAFEDFLKKVGEDETNATRYAIAADAISMGFCAASISLGHYAERYGTHRLLCRRGPINSQALNFFKLSLFSVAASIALSFIIFYDARPGPTRHVQIGWPFVAYVVVSSLAMESLFELVPFLFVKRDFLTGWSLTVFIRHLSKYLLKMCLPAATQSLPLWSIILLGALTPLLLMASTAGLIFLEGLRNEPELFVSLHKNQETSRPLAPSDSIRHR